MQHLNYALIKKLFWGRVGGEVEIRKRRDRREERSIKEKKKGERGKDSKKKEEES